MGLIKGIADAVLEKAKHEVKDYLIKFMEEEKEKEKSKVEQEADSSLKKDESKQSETRTEKEVVEIVSEDEEDEILPLIKPQFIKLTYKTVPTDFRIPSELVDLAMMLPVIEFSCYMKLLMFAAEQRKNFGYLGNTLKKKLGFDDLEGDDFEMAMENLEKYGLLAIDQVSENQRTFIIYLPFDQELYSKVETQNQAKKRNSKNNRKKGSGNPGNEKENTRTEEVKNSDNDLPGKMMIGMENEDLYKSYRTFVSLEIDKAKMRVGRSNFDKIYMEAVKYIDKKYGFKVLSDSEKFKEHLTNYYISAFDILTFEQWKKNKS
jgi:hypothetical protein